MKKNKDSDNMRLATTIILNRTLQTYKSPVRKTLKQIAKEHDCSVDKVSRVEHYLLGKLIEKISVLKILIQIK